MGIVNKASIQVSNPLHRPPRGRQINWVFPLMGDNAVFVQVLFNVTFKWLDLLLKITEPYLPQSGATGLRLASESNSLYSFIHYAQ